MKNFLIFLCGLFFTLVILRIGDKREYQGSYVTPKWEMLKKSEGKIILSPLTSGRRHSKGTVIKLVFDSGKPIYLTCSLYGGMKCYKFEDIYKPKSYFEQLAFQKATVWWLPIKNKKQSGRVYQVEQNGKVVIDFESFDLRYQQEALNKVR